MLRCGFAWCEQMNGQICGMKKITRFIKEDLIQVNFNRYLMIATLEGVHKWSVNEEWITIVSRSFIL